MAVIRKGRCTNFGNCSVADSNKIVDVAPGDDLRCPECKRALSEIPVAAQPGQSRSLSALLIALLALILIGYAGFRLANRRSSGNGSGSTTAPTSGPEGGTAALRLCGSNTIGAELAPALASAYLKAQGASDTNSHSQGQDEVTVGSGSNAISVKAHGSATAFEGLTSGSCDIGMASRRVKDSEIASLRSLGDMTSPASEHVLGLDGIAVIVNRSNPVSSLTVQQIASIFEGKGGGRQMNVYARDEKSGTYDTFKALVLGSGTLVDTSKRFEDSRQLSDAVANDANGIGFVGLPYIGNAKAVAVSEPGARALLPNRFTVATEDYLLSRRLFLYTASNPKPEVRRFVDFALSKQGQEIVGANGFVEQNVRVEQTSLPEGASSKYAQSTRGAERLSLDFRFRTGSSELDNKALADVDRVTQLLSDLHYSGSNVLLLGFADSTGSPPRNVSLSVDRAKAVASNFGQRGVEPGSVTGFGADMPVASNDNEAGRQKNRRVEIWVRK